MCSVGCNHGCSCHSGNLICWCLEGARLSATNVWFWFLSNVLYDHNIHQTTVCMFFWTWWRHQVDIFSALLDLCAGNSPVTGEFPAQRPVTRIFDVFFDLRLNKRMSKTTVRLRRHRGHIDVTVMMHPIYCMYVFRWCCRLSFGVV